MAFFFFQECVNSIDAGSQVCSLLWSRHSRELVTSHGFTDFQLSVWKYPSLVRIADLKGHESRVLYTALSPDGKTVCVLQAGQAELGVLGAPCVPPSPPTHRVSRIQASKLAPPPPTLLYTWEIGGGGGRDPIQVSYLRR